MSCLTDREHERGSVLAITAVAMLPLMMMAAVVVDGGQTYLQRQKVQTAAEATAIAAAQNWARTGASCSAGAMTLADANAGPTSSPVCSTTGTRTGGVTTVRVGRRADTIFGGLLRRTAPTMTATASAAVGAPNGISGLRPIALCINNPAVQTWRNSGFSSTAVIRTYFEGSSGGVSGTSCGSAVPGNWAVLDYAGGSSSNSTTRDWVVNGYPGVVTVPSTVWGNPGIVSGSIGLETLVGTTMIVPIFDTAINNGSNSRYSLVSFAGLTVVATMLTGNAESRYIDVRFSRVTTVASHLDTTVPDLGTVTWKLCSLDGQGSCP
jgi:Flp pilus assembly protein TadG